MTDRQAFPTGSADQALLVLDFDGTLAPIVEDPSQARMPSQTADVVARLSGRLGQVAIVSGRPVSYLSRWAPLPGVVLIGLYGLERSENGSVVLDPRVRPYEGALAQAAEALAGIAEAHPGAHVEDKGAMLALHWRRADDTPRAQQQIPAAVREVADRLGLGTGDGKMVVEVHPPVKVTKGDAVRSLIGDGDVAFAGDDVGDLPAFEAVSAAGGLTILVDHGDETDPRLTAAADTVVDGTDGLLAWLRELDARLA